jgi:hypothetical protein
MDSFKVESADLVYFRENLQGLKKVLESERKAAHRRE